MQELGVLQMVSEHDNIELYHVHTMKSEEHKLWNAGDIINTQQFSRQPSYNPPKRFRERAFEIVRQKDFPQMPSRTNCLFLSASLETAKVWYNILGGEKQLFKIKPIEGKCVFLDEKIYENEEFTDAVMNSDANDYWSGDECIENNKISVLFEGVFRIEEEIDFSTI